MVNKVCQNQQTPNTDLPWKGQKEEDKKSAHPTGDVHKSAKSYVPLKYQIMKITDLTL